MKNLIVLMGLLCLLSSIQAQESDERFYLQIAYAGGMITHPGLNVEAGYSLGKWSRTKKTGQLVDQEIRLGLKFGTYFHKRMQTGIYLGPTLGWIRTGNKGFQLGINFSAGYLKTIVPNTYTIEDGGMVQSQKGSGNQHFFWMPGIRLGKDFSKNGSGQLEWFVNNQLMFQSPYFDKTNKYLLTEFGINLKLR